MPRVILVLFLAAHLACGTDANNLDVCADASCEEASALQVKIRKQEPETECGFFDDFYYYAAQWYFGAPCSELGDHCDRVHSTGYQDVQVKCACRDACGEPRRTPTTCADLQYEPGCCFEYTCTTPGWIKKVLGQWTGYNLTGREKENQCCMPCMDGVDPFRNDDCDRASEKGFCEESKCDKDDGDYYQGFWCHGRVGQIQEQCAATCGRCECSKPQNMTACMAAAKAQGLKWDGSRNWSDRLPGCLRTVADTDVNWNKNENGGYGHLGQLPLCE